MVKFVKQALETVLEVDTVVETEKRELIEPKKPIHPILDTGLEDLFNLEPDLEPEKPLPLDLNLDQMESFDE